MSPHLPGNPEAEMAFRRPLRSLQIFRFKELKNGRPILCVRHHEPGQAASREQPQDENSGVTGPIENGRMGPNLRNSQRGRS
jgi:hypothetical protein